MPELPPFLFTALTSRPKHMRDPVTSQLLILLFLLLNYLFLFFFYRTSGIGCDSNFLLLRAVTTRNVIITACATQLNLMGCVGSDLGLMKEVVGLDKLVTLSPRVGFLAAFCKNFLDKGMLVWT
ncbi:UNVERIFIED_CONTAM: hypothetical protein K2H54_046818 [Gekko kuhli]